LGDADELDLESLAAVLKPHVVIDKKTGGVHLTKSFSGLTTRKKVLLVLLAQKAAALLEVATCAGMTPKSIETTTGLPGGTVRAKLAELKKDRLVDADAGGQYTIALHHMQDSLAECSPLGGKAASS